jgi:hypothetical protein
VAEGNLQRQRDCHAAHRRAAAYRRA